MMKIARFAIAALAMLSINVATVALAETPAPPVPDGAAGHILGCLRIVNLTESQKAATRQVFETAKPAVTAAAEKVRSEGEKLRALLEATTKDACAIGNGVLAVQAAKESLRTELEKVRTQVADILTPEQKAMLAGCLAAPHGGPRGNMADSNPED